MLPKSVVANLAGQEVTAAFAGAEVNELRQLGDSMAALSSKLATASTADREALQAELRRVRTEMREIERAVAKVARERVRGEIQVSIPKVQVEIKAPEAPKPPSASPPNR